MQRRWLVMCCALAFVVASCSVERESGSTSTTATESIVSTPEPVEPVRGPTTDAFEPADCADVSDRRFTGASVLYECGFVTVPLDHDEPEGASIRIATVLIVDVLDASPAHGRPPTVFLPGGPGLSGVSAAPDWRGFPSNVILMDERGVGSSIPALDCPELEVLYPESLLGSFEDLVSGPETAEAVEACYDRLSGEGVDFELFGSDQSALDIGVVHRALGFEEVDLFGLSYGTRLALTKLRDQPEGIRSVILDSVVPLDVSLLEDFGPNAVRAFDALNTACASQACGSEIEDIGLLVDSLGNRLAASPVTITAERPFGLGPVEVALDKDWPGFLVFQALYDTDLIRTVPSILSQASDGDMDAFIPLVEGALPSLDSGTPWSEGLWRAMLCYEEYPFNDPDTIEENGAAVPSYLREYVQSFDPDCQVWMVDPAPEIESLAVTNPSDVPVLVLAGGLDQVTPPSYSKLVADRLGASYIEHPGAGHWVTPTSECTTTIVSQWLDDPNEIDLGCAAGLTDAEFFGFD